MKARIIKRTNVDGCIEYVIQQKHGLFRWWWVDAWVNLDTLEEAQKNLCYYDGSKVKEEVVIQ